MCREDARKHEKWMKDVLKKYEQTNMESTIMFIMNDLKPQLQASESQLRTGTHPESVQHHFNTQLYVDEFVKTHKSHIRHTMGKFTKRWEVPHLSIGFPYMWSTNEDWRKHHRNSTSIINISEALKRSLDLLLT